MTIEKIELPEPTPYKIVSMGFSTKLGNVRFSDFEAGSDWDNGFRSMQPARVASQKEIQAAQSVDVSRFRKKANRYYK